MFKERNKQCSLAAMEKNSKLLPLSLSFSQNQKDLVSSKKTSLLVIVCVYAYLYM